jgi:NAD(P)-dependent dehydrogenase (short-subunit alcohol dehydrogenase family)
MMRQRSGSIINVTARAAGFTPKGDRAQGTVAYAVSKAALNRLSYFMAEELKPYGSRSVPSARDRPDRHGGRGSPRTRGQRLGQACRARSAGSGTPLPSLADGRDLDRPDPPHRRVPEELALTHSIPRDRRGPEGCDVAARLLRGWSDDHH